MKFYEHLPRLFPQNPGMARLFETSPDLIEATAKRNSSLQGAYLIIAARGLGLDCGPMSGFDQTCFGCDQEFFPEGHVKSNFLCNLGASAVATRIAPGTPHPFVKPLSLRAHGEPDSTRAGAQPRSMPTSVQPDEARRKKNTDGCDHPRCWG